MKRRLVDQLLRLSSPVVIDWRQRGSTLAMHDSWTSATPAPRNSTGSGIWMLVCRCTVTRNLNAVSECSIPVKNPCCPQAGGRCSVTGRLWPFRTGMVKPARQPASRNTGEQGRLLARVGNAEGGFGECGRALAIASASLPKTASSEVVLGRSPFGQPPRGPEQLVLRAALQTWLRQPGAPAFPAWVGAPG